MSESPISLRDATGVERFRGTQSPGGGSQPVTPPDIPGLAFWLDASDHATINAGSPSDGDAVSAWADKSASGYDVAQATADNQPVYKTAIQNALAVVRFDPTSFPQYLALSGGGLDLFRNVSGVTIAVAAVGVDPGDANNETFLFASSGTDAAVIRALAQHQSGASFSNDDAQNGPLDIVAAAPITATAAAMGWPGAMCQVAAADFLGANLAFEATTQPAISGSNFALPAGATPDTPSLAAQVGVAAFASSTPLQGDLGELIVYRRALNFLERRQLLEYLSAKWATL